MNGVNICTTNTKYQLKAKKGSEPISPKVKKVTGRKSDNAVTVWRDGGSELSPVRVKFVCCW